MVLSGGTVSVEYVCVLCKGEGGEAHMVAEGLLELDDGYFSGVLLLCVDGV